MEEPPVKSENSLSSLRAPVKRSAKKQTNIARNSRGSQSSDSLLKNGREKKEQPSLTNLSGRAQKAENRTRMSEIASLRKEIVK